MKKMFLIAAIAAVAGLTSCKKDYTCNCVVLGSTIPLPIQNSSKNDAESTCDAAQGTYQIADPSASCTLD